MDEFIVFIYVIMGIVILALFSFVFFISEGNKKIDDMDCPELRDYNMEKTYDRAMKRYILECIEMVETKDGL